MLALLLGDARADSRPRIVVGSKNFPESRLLAEIMAQLIEGHLDVDVERKTNLGGTTVVHTALVDGQIDLYPEYTGTAYTVQLQHVEPTRGQLQVFLTVKREYAEAWDLVWLDPFGFANSYAIGMPKAKAEALGVTRLSELGPHAGRARGGA